MYKINIHAHTLFSDGLNTPYKMALKAKELGFSALVLTDHYYGDKTKNSVSKISMMLLRKACVEAEDVLPVIVGLEVPLAGQEVLAFGSVAIRWILNNRLPTLTEIERLKENLGCAVILCHPGANYEKAASVADGFERYNSGQDFFRKDRPLIDNKVSWCNSDAHCYDNLDSGYNIVDTKIETEHELINYIQSGKQPKFCVRGKYI